MLKSYYREYCMKRENTVLGKAMRSAPLQSPEQDGSDGDDELAGTANEAKGGRKLEVAWEGERSLPVFSPFAKAAV